MLRIDCQSHIFPAAYAELLTRNQGKLQANGGNELCYINSWKSSTLA